ncbi:hypothetical protein BDN70DRAFT_490609 [Pholiota conissans]|uniref:Uncharacterized protein n=1 Tax=Pholiota conissans TaxID=109636 RepID=A0A9P5YNN3_9AGAR|nr:hypothetical protein BDN70DRAFT_490609 [Pholiota conissans]
MLLITNLRLRRMVIAPVVFFFMLSAFHAYRNVRAGMSSKLFDMSPCMNDSETSDVRKARDRALRMMVGTLVAALVCYCFNVSLDCRHHRHRCLYKCEYEQDEMRTSFCLYLWLGQFSCASLDDISYNAFPFMANYRNRRGGPLVLGDLKVDATREVHIKCM